MESILGIVNQIFEMEQKLASKGDSSGVTRNVNRMKHYLEEYGYTFYDPLHEDYNDMRTDCEASIVGDFEEGNMYISKVIKPIIFKEGGETPVIIQKAVVIVEKKA
ncbi:hypothetical protein JMN32_02385 [Fulvivirga sp. 29W222]|uniref:Uncharacterized protein n=1 Tax=Fulvivirga marina TaxID=2494733 RepID=A0A937FUD1_9BACT|nr:hypothetical protein [Fulvivirga marina]MBL6445138.1 hypothetical protein [Fulvivirga marina]